MQRILFLGLAVVSGFFISGKVFGQTWIQMNKSTPPDRAANDLFGNTISMSGNIALVGAPQNDVDTVGSNPLNNAGGAYIYHRLSNGKWQLHQKLVASDRAAADFFGFSVSISGNIAVVGAYQEDQDAIGTGTLSAAGSVYIFEANGNGQWVQTAKLVASDRAAGDQFGYSVALSGNHLIVGARYEDEDAAGANYLLNTGSVYMFERLAGGTWMQVAKICAPDRWEKDQFGTTVAIDGNYAAVGVRFEDEDSLGNNTLINAGSAYVIEKSIGGAWNLVKKITAHDRAASDMFGCSIAISGNQLLVGAFQEDHNPAGTGSVSNAGSVYYYLRNGGGQWIQTQKLVASDRQPSDHFGFSVSINQQTAVIGARYEDEDALLSNTISAAGSTYVFKNLSGLWVQEQKVVASDRAVSDNLGSWVTGAGNYLVSSAKLEDEDELGNNTMTSAGSIYFYERCTQPDVPSLSSVTTQFCAGSAVTLQIGGNLGSANYWYLRKGSCTAAPIDSTTGNSFTILVNATETYYVQGAGGCTGTGNGCSSITYTVNPTPVVTASPDQQVCQGMSVTLNASSSVPISWSGGISNGVPFQPAVGTYPYIASATGANGCVGTDTVWVTANPLPAITISGNTSICLGSSTQLTAAGAISWAWNTGATTPTISVSPSSNTTYTVDGTDANGCMQTGVITVMVANASIDTTVTEAGGTLFTNQTGVSYQWVNCLTGLPIPGATSASFTPGISGSYAVVLTGACTQQSGCHSVLLTSLEPEKEGLVRIWPNPGTHSVSLAAPGTFDYRLLDAAGREILAGSGEELVHLSVSGLPAGVYFWQIHTTENQLHMRWIKQ